jgi:hypothetical protein
VGVDHVPQTGVVTPVSENRTQCERGLQRERSLLFVAATGTCEQLLKIWREYSALCRVAGIRSARSSSRVDRMRSHVGVPLTSGEPGDK